VSEIVGTGDSDADSIPERELASVTITMGLGGADNPLISQPGAILFAAESEGHTNPHAVWICNLSDSDHKRYLDALDTLTRVHVTNLFSTALQSARDMMTVLGEAYKAIYADEISSVSPDDFVQWTVRLRTSILGVCAMIHHHQEQSYAEVIRKYGTDSPEHKAMKAAFGEVYDNCFGYRYLYKLRNCMIHYSMRVVDIGTNSQSHDGKPLHWFGITMKRSVMLKARKLLNANLRAELEALDEDPDIVRMQTDAFKELVKVNRRIIEILRPNISEVCATVREFDRLFEGRDGARGLAINRSAELRSPFAFEYYPVAGRVIMAARRYGEITEAEG
jgi:flagellin-specific chaperone FliS